MRSLICLLALVALTFSAVVVNHDNEVECLACESTVKSVAPMLGQDTAAIEKKADADCKKALSSIPFGPAECKKFINSHLDPIIKELEAGTAPADVCKKLDMCTK